MASIPGNELIKWLSITHGIVQKYGGLISVDSRVDQGTSICIYLPIIEGGSKPTEVAEKVPGGTEHLLVVDDEPTIIRMMTERLKRLGYTVTPCTSSVEALATFKTAPDQYDLVITDMTMPKITGDELAAELIRIRADIPIILCTGYSQRITDESVDKIGVKALLMKPLSMTALANAIRDVIDQAKP